MKKIMLSGIVVVFSVMVFAALAFADQGHGGHAMPAAPGSKPAAPGSGPGAPGGHEHGGSGMMGGGCMGGQGMMSGMMGGGQGMMGGMMGGQGRGQGMGSGMMGGRMMEAERHLAMYLGALGLDEKQNKAIGEIRSTIQKDAIRKMADISIMRIETKDLLLQDPVDMKAVEAKVKQIGMLRTEMNLAHLKALESIKAQLTPEQRKKLTDMMKTGPMMLVHE